MKLHAVRIWGMSLLLGCSLVVAQAQDESGNRGARAPFTLSGQLLDENTGQPLEYSTVSAFRLPDSTFAGGTITDASGAFSHRTGPGRYLLKLEFLGYQTRWIGPFAVNRQTPSVDVGTAFLIPSAAVLEEAVIEAERSQVSLSLEKKTFEVGKDLASIGGSASDVLENVPAVTVDDDGSISLRGSGNVRILIDGRQSGLVGLNPEEALRMLPADLIERVEVITNPSARYDAEGMTGIINIITKKNQRKGTQGTFTVNAGIPTNWQASANLSHRTEDWTFSGGYAYRNTVFDGFSNEDRTTQRGNGVQRLLQDQDRSRAGVSHNVQSGVEYRQNRFATWEFKTALAFSDGLNQNNVTYRDFQPIGEVRSYRYNEEQEDRFNVDGALNYTRTFAKKDRKLMVDLTYAQTEETEDTDATQFSESLNPADFLGVPFQHTFNKEFLRNGVFQVDYIEPLRNKGKLEFGSKNSLRIIETDYRVEERASDTSDWAPVPGISNGLLYDETILAAYAMYSQTWGKFGLAAGLRGEYSRILIRQNEQNEENLKEYIDPFPTLHLSYDLGNARSMQLSYSRRIRRPSFWNLNPFFNFENPLSFRSGNPDLDPEYTHALEAGFLIFRERWNINPSIYYRYSTGVIQFVQTVVGDVTLTRPENAAEQQDYGIELTGSYTPYDWWQWNVTWNGFGATLDGNNIENGREVSFFTWNLQASTNFKIPKVVNVQLRANYEAERETAQGKRLSIGFLNIGLTRDILKGQGTLSMQVRDALNTRVRRSETTGADFDIYSERRWRPRTFIFGFTYRLKGSERQRSNFPGGGMDGNS